MAGTSESVSKRPRIMESDTIEQLILEVLQYTSSFQEGGDGEPLPLVKITQLADSEEGWCNVVMAMITTIPLHNPLGLSTIAVIFDFCPLPARDTVLGFTQSLHLTPARCATAYLSEENVRCERNLLFLIGCIADKFGSHSSVPLLTDDMLEYLITFLVDEKFPELVLGALVALEKLAGTAMNKAAIEAGLARRLLHPLLPLELRHSAADYAWRRVAFAARWALDNTFTFPGRKFSFETVKVNDIGVMLNIRDMSNYLKISPNGLEARCDSLSFESIRGTLELKFETWYYEVELVTAGVMQIGWATKSTNFDSHEGYGVGDDQFSIAYDGCRRLVWHKAEATRVDLPMRPWKPGDVLGCLADCINGEIVFSLNGLALPPYKPAFVAAGDTFYAAATFMVDQQCIFNFGARPFAYPPSDRMFSNMNDCGSLTIEQKMILPRCVEMEMVLADGSAPERRCAVCLESDGGFGIDPCRHSGFCPRCVLMLDECPLCRSQVKNIYLLAP